ncbi:MAG TPA: hypothetical protein VK764_09135 [Terracidiphilus sp.]|jgi:hypothetical protein|nr:hypothetical protein [Terracidiphilus sp.]
MESMPVRRTGAGSFLGFPLEGFSLFQSLLLAFAAAFFTFFASTFLAIMALLVWDGLLHHSVNFADSYLFVGFPAGLLVLLIALPVFGTLWVRAKLRN